MTLDEFIVELSGTSRFDWGVRENGRKIRARIMLPPDEPHCPDFPEYDRKGYYYACPISALASLRVPDKAWGYTSAARFLGLDYQTMSDIADAADCNSAGTMPIRKKILAATGL
jgi:hypothetical protein